MEVIYSYLGKTCQIFEISMSNSPYFEQKCLTLKLQ